MPFEHSDELIIEGDQNEDRFYTLHEVEAMEEELSKQI